MQARTAEYLVLEEVLLKIEVRTVILFDSNKTLRESVITGFQKCPFFAGTSACENLFDSNKRI